MRRGAPRQPREGNAVDASRGSAERLVRGAAPTGAPTALSPSRFMIHAPQALVPRYPPTDVLCVTSCTISNALGRGQRIGVLGRTPRQTPDGGDRPSRLIASDYVRCTVRLRQITSDYVRSSVRLRQITSDVPSDYVRSRQITSDYVRLRQMFKITQ